MRGVMEHFKAAGEILKELHLPAIRQNLKDVIERSDREGLDTLSVIIELLEMERANRVNNRYKRLLKMSRLPSGKDYSSLELNRFSPVVQRKIKALNSGQFLDNYENVLVFGKPGAGKTHILSAIAYELIRQGHRVLFTTALSLVQDLLRAKNDYKLPALLKQMKKFRAVILDDIGYVEQSREEMEALFSFLAYRYETGSVMISSNLAFSGWEKIFKDKMTTAAAIDRLVHHSVIFELNVPSYRAAKAKRKKKEEAK